MITNFEVITAELTEDEKKLIPLVLKGFAAKTKSTAIKAPAIIQAINSKKDEYGLKAKLTEPRLRKICNFLRSEGIIPLIATSDGYFVSNDTEEIRKQIKSMTERADAIMNAAHGLEKFLIP